jgi:thioredoxin 1
MGQFMNRYSAGIRLRKILLLSVAAVMASGIAWAEDFNNLPVKGMVTMIDLGADKCIPCKMMAPILVKMEKQYEGKAAIVFIDVWKHNEQAGRFGIRAIPTQIFFDQNGKEVFRHVGFMSEKAIVNQLKKMGVN